MALRPHYNIYIVFAGFSYQLKQKLFFFLLHRTQRQTELLTHFHPMALNAVFVINHWHQRDVGKMSFGIGALMLQPHKY